MTTQHPAACSGDRSAHVLHGRLRRRRLAGTLLVLLAAGAGGYPAGLESERDPRAAARENTAAEAGDRAISRDVNWVLLELWKMEGTERAGLPPGSP